MPRKKLTRPPIPNGRSIGAALHIDMVKTGKMRWSLEEAARIFGQPIDTMHDFLSNRGIEPDTVPAILYHAGMREVFWNAN